MQRVVIVGGGFGGLAAARALEGAAVQVVLVDRVNHHLFQPLLYQVATAALSPADIAWPLRTLFRGQQNIRITLGEVTKIDRAARCVLLSETAPIPYDRLILAPGARHAYFGHEDWEMHAPGLKTIPDALELRERMLMAFEQAQQAGDAQRASDYLTFVIVGGGPTGVELAGALMEIGRRAMAPDFPVLHRAEFRVILIEGGGRILEAFPPDLSGKAQTALEALGVTVMVNCRVHDVTGQGVLAGAQFIRTANVLWAAGNIASPILRSLDVPLDQTGRVRVERDLSLPGDPWTFVIGDAAHCESPEGRWRVELGPSTTGRVDCPRHPEGASPVLSLQGSWHVSHHRQSQGRGPIRTCVVFGPGCLVGLVFHPYILFDRLPEPVSGDGGMDLVLHHVQARCTIDLWEAAGIARRGSRGGEWAALSQESYRFTARRPITNS